MNSCIFCDIYTKKIPSETIYESKRCFVIRDIHPQAPIHYLVITKNHYPEFIETPEEATTDALSLAKTIIVKEKIANYRLTNNGQGAAFVDHFHLHILGSIQQNRGL